VAGLPKKLYYVLVKPGGTPLKFRQKGGGTYTNRDNALSQYQHLKAHGSNVELYSTNINWEKIASHETNPMDGEPGLW